MKLIVGLGNPGEKYENTRHNVGFMVLDHLLKDLQPVNKSNWTTDKKLKSEIFSLEYKSKKEESEIIILAKPLTYMNNSGLAVSLIMAYYKIKPIDVWVVYDELDLPLGFMKMRFGGSAAGHHGVDSIMETIKTEKFWRFRLGIGLPKTKDGMNKQKINGQEFVLKGFRGGEASKLRVMIKRGSKAIETALEKGMESSMNQFNTK
jgi:peptidyl-tRNA hydrolase, PTH1 family